ncbi:MAG: hypothetical protein OEV94_11560 [Deltaproteobacteria bacterium]|nr:hypothetical protein [Deltaproteobacteria bacterium]
MRKPESDGSKTVASMIKDAIERNGYKDVKECARSIKVPYDLFNKVVGGHIPKDPQLVDYAKKLKIDHRELLLAAYKERAPDEMKKYFNSVALLDNHRESVREILDIVDTLTEPQVEEVLLLARMIRQAPRETCNKATALLALYQQMNPDLMEHFNALVLLSLRGEDIKGLKNFRNAVGDPKPQRPMRRPRG